MKNCKERKIDDQSEKIKNAKKGFQIIVRSLDNGETLLDKKTRCIIGSIALEQRGENQALIMANCNTPTLIVTIDSAEEVILEAKKKVVKDADLDKLLASVIKKLL